MSETTGKTHLTSREHFIEAERLIANTQSWAASMFSDEHKRNGRTPLIMSVEIDYTLRLAQIHATLASTSVDYA